MPGEVQYIYPTREELMAIEPDMMDQLTLNDPIFQLFPIRNVDSHVISWEQRDNYLGLQKVRGLDGQPGRVAAVGGKKYTYEPGVYGEELLIPESELTTRRPYGVAAGAVNIQDLVLERNNQARHREINRIRYILWTLLGTGTFSVSTDHGAVLHTDTYELQTYTRAVDWGTPATATPLADFRGVVALAAGHGVNLGGSATAFMTRANFNELCSNTNASDLAGKRTDGLAQPIGLEAINRVLLAEDLPQIQVYDEGYYSDANVFTRFIPANTVIIVGKRQNGDPLGEYLMTRNANNPDLGPGSYAQVVDSLLTGQPVPRRISVHRGHNGGPVIYYPSGVVVMSV